MFDNIFASNNSENRKYFLNGLAPLTSLGGFIKDQIEEEAYSLYPLVAEMLKKYYPIGPGFCYIADVVDENFAELRRYEVGNAENDEEEYYDFLEEYGESVVVSDTAFLEWVEEQIVRLTAENYKKCKSCSWEKLDLDMQTKAALSHLNALDERVLALIIGVENNPQLNVIQIAQLQEFSCSENYILRVIDAIKNTFIHYGASFDEFFQICITKQGGNNYV